VESFKKKEMYVLVHIKFTLIVERKTDLIHQHVELRHRWLATYISHRPCPTKQQVKNLIKVFESGLWKWSKSEDFPNPNLEIFQIIRCLDDVGLV
jgi:hypothetical protein